MSYNTDLTDLTDLTFVYENCSSVNLHTHQILNDSVVGYVNFFLYLYFPRPQFGLSLPY